MKQGPLIVVRRENLLNIIVEHKMTAIDEENSRVSVESVGPDHKGQMSVDLRM